MATIDVKDKYTFTVKPGFTCYIVSPENGAAFKTFILNNGVELRMLDGYENANGQTFCYQIESFQVQRHNAPFKQRECYSMKRVKLGIIHVFNLLHNDIDMINIEASIKDCEIIKHTFEKMDFEVKIYMPNSSVLQTITTVLNENYSDYNIFALFFISHGEEGKFIIKETSEDKEPKSNSIQFYEIKKLLNENTSLQSIPKLVFSESCRGDIKDDQIIQSTGVKAQNSNKSKSGNRADFSDIHWACSTVESYVSASQKCYSPWVNLLCKQIEEKHKNVEFQQIYLEFKNFMTQYILFDNGNNTCRLQMPDTIKNTLTKFLYLNMIVDTNERENEDTENSQLGDEEYTSNQPNFPNIQNEFQQTINLENIFDLGKTLILKKNHENSEQKVFWLPKDINCYLMSKICRGQALVIVNEKFQERFKDRGGTSIDKENLNNLFTYLGFKVHCYINQSAANMKQIIKKFASTFISNDEMCIIAISSHGSQDLVYGVDGENIATDDILNSFNNLECPILVGKPKMFIFNWGQGNKVDSGVLKTSEEHFIASKSSPKEKITKEFSKIPIWEDMLIVKSSVPGYISFRNPNTGSTFITMLCKVFEANAWKLDLIELLNVVMDEMKKYEIKIQSSSVKQSFVYENRHFSKKLYFNPDFFINEEGNVEEYKNCNNLDF